MLNNFTPVNQLEMQNQVGLYSMVNRVSSNSIAAATSRRSFIINDIPCGLQVNTNERMLATVFGSLLNTLITHTKECCIRISAKTYGKIALLSLKESHQANGKSSIANVRQIQELAEKLGGSVSISYDQKKVTTIIFSFTNNISVAA